MEEKNKKKILAIICAVIALIVVGTTYAFITITLTGTKKVTITAGTLSLVLNEGNAITISDALPMYDEVGMIQDKVFNFSLANNTSNDTKYVLKLTKIASANELSTSDVKYYLTKEGVGEPALLSSLTDGVIDTGTIVGNDTIDYTLRLWIDSSLTDQTLISGKSLSYRIDVEASMVEENSNQTVTFAGITKEVNPTQINMFKYTSEGRYVSDYTAWTKDLDTNYITNGIYAMEDDDGPSYFYRGEVDNLVKFGQFTKDYYVYRHVDYMNREKEFLTLDACKSYNSSCSENNKVLKYAASDNVPMYWRIIRVNGDGTIRMIYAGNAVEVDGIDSGIGFSPYVDEATGARKVGYTYDRMTDETESLMKKTIDTWYANVFEGTIYDEKITIGKFCNDTSGYTDYYEHVRTGESVDPFAPYKRANPYNIGLGEPMPTFKCPVTEETYGGSYDLKAGLITLDEVVAAGGHNLSNSSYYLSSDTWAQQYIETATMSPSLVTDATAYMSVIGDDGSFGGNHAETNYLVRPVINLRADVVFKEGTDGSKERPYELAE